MAPADEDHGVRAPVASNEDAPAFASAATIWLRQSTFGPATLHGGCQRRAKVDQLAAKWFLRTVATFPRFWGLQGAPRAGGLREALQMVFASRQAVLVSRTKVVNELNSLTAVTPEHLPRDCQAVPCSSN